MSLTDSLQRDRLTVVEVDTATGRLRVKSDADLCTDLTCRGTLVVTDEGQDRDLARLNPGDIITLEMTEGQPTRVRVVRRVWDEYSSPEW